MSDQFCLKWNNYQVSIDVRVLDLIVLLPGFTYQRLQEPSGE